MFAEDFTKKKVNKDVRPREFFMELTQPAIPAGVVVSFYSARRRIKCFGTYKT